jgi:hypothetical protein
MKVEAWLIKGKLISISAGERLVGFLQDGDENKWPDAFPIARDVPLPSQDDLGEMFRFKIVNEKIVEMTPA